jgi:hypothetical protein
LFSPERVEHSLRTVKPLQIAVAPFTKEPARNAVLPIAPLFYDSAVFDLGDDAARIRAVAIAGGSKMF